MDIHVDTLRKIAMGSRLLEQIRERLHTRLHLSIELDSSKLLIDRSDLKNQIAFAEAQIAGLEKLIDLLIKNCEFVSQVNTDHTVFSPLKTAPERQVWVSSQLDALQSIIESTEANTGLKLDFEENRLRVTFQLDRNRPCWALLQVKDNGYSLIEVSPNIDSVEELVAALSINENFSAFVRALRQAFRDSGRIES